MALVAQISFLAARTGAATRRLYWAHRLKLVHAMGLNTVSPCALFGFHRARPSGIVRGNNK